MPVIVLSKTGQVEKPAEEKKFIRKMAAKLSRTSYSFAKWCIRPLLRESEAAINASDARACNKAKENFEMLPPYFQTVLSNQINIVENVILADALGEVAKLNPCFVAAYLVEDGYFMVLNFGFDPNNAEETKEICGCAHDKMGFAEFITGNSSAHMKKNLFSDIVEFVFHISRRGYDAYQRVNQKTWEEKIRNLGQSGYNLADLPAIGAPVE